MRQNQNYLQIQFFPKINFCRDIKSFRNTLLAKFFKKKMFICLLLQEFATIKIIPQIKLMSMIISIEHCKNCLYHNWCSRHDQRRYEQLALDLKSRILKENSDINILINHIPASYRKYDQHGRSNKYYDRQQNEFIIFPRLGSFQVYVDKMLISSKILTASWPIIQDITQKIKTIIERKKENKDISEFDLSHKLFEHKQPLGKKKQQMQKFRKTYLSQASYTRRDVNDLYVAQIKKIYEVPNKNGNKPKFLKDGLTQMYKNKSDLFEQSQQQAQKKKIKMYQSSYGTKFKKQIKGIQYLEKTPYEIMREKKEKKHSKHRFADHNKKHNSVHHNPERGSPKKILFEQGVYFNPNDKKSQKDIEMKASLQKELYKMLQQDQLNQNKKKDTKQLMNKRPQYKASYRSNHKPLNKKANNLEESNIKKQVKAQESEQPSKEEKRQKIQNYLIKNEQEQTKNLAKIQDSNIKQDEIVEQENQQHQKQQNNHQSNKQQDQQQPKLNHQQKINADQSNIQQTNKQMSNAKESKNVQDATQKQNANQQDNHEQDNNEQKDNQQKKQHEQIQQVVSEQNKRERQDKKQEQAQKPIQQPKQEQIEQIHEDHNKQIQQNPEEPVKQHQQLKNSQIQEQDKKNIQEALVQ